MSEDMARRRMMHTVQAIAGEPHITRVSSSVTLPVGRPRDWESWRKVTWALWDIQHKRQEWMKKPKEERDAIRLENQYAVARIRLARLRRAHEQATRPTFTLNIDGSSLDSPALMKEIAWRPKTGIEIRGAKQQPPPVPTGDQFPKLHQVVKAAARACEVLRRLFRV